MSAKNPDEKYSVETSDDFNTFEDKQLLRKVDFRLIPILTLLYLLSFLDRSMQSTNVGNAKILGLTTDLHVPPGEYNIALALYFVAYVIFEVPANIILKRFDPRLWLPTLTLVWGIVSITQGLVRNKAGLFGIRFLLRVTEAGLFPGVIYVFSVYYRRHERSWRVAIFFGGAAVAGAFGGILAYAIGKMNSVGGKKGWEWIFILEGALTVAVSLVAYFIVPTWSHKATFLTESEKKRLLARLGADSDAALIERFEWVYGFAFVLYSLSLFMPTIIAGLGFQSWQAQLMTVPPNALAAISIWTTVWLSSRFDKKAPFVIGSASVAIVGYIILLTTKTPGAQYTGVHFAAAGIHTGNALLLSWPGENVSAQIKRAVAVAMQITVGDIGAIAGVLIYRPSLQAHRFRTPHIISIGYLLFSELVTLYLWTWMGRENKRRDRDLVLAQVKGDAGFLASADKQRLGDRDLRYRYVI